MAVTDLIDQAQAAGVRFVLDDSRVGLRGDQGAVAEWAPRLRRHKHALLIELQKRLAGLHRIWVIRPPMRDAFAVACPQGATADEVRNVWTGAVVEPRP